MIDPTKATLSLTNENKIDLTIPSFDAVPSLFLAGQPTPHLTSPFHIIPPLPTPPTPPPPSGNQTNFGIGWWLYVNSGPFIPNNTNFGPGWFSFVNSR